MKKIIAMLTLILLVASIAASALAWEYVQTYGGPTYVRSGPGLDYKILDTLRTYESYHFEGRIARDDRGVDWYQVYYAGRHGDCGWVSSLQADLIDGETGYVY